MTSYQTLISTADLAQHLDDPDWAVIDCRFSLDDTERGRNDYLRAHIPGAVYAHLDEDLSGEIQPGTTGRHPLPQVEAAAVKFSDFGIEPGVQVVAYDDARGSLAAVRLWWLLRWLGHDTAAVLDGGWQQWTAEGRPVRAGNETRSSRNFFPQLRPDKEVRSGELEQWLQDPAHRIIDVRARERYLGENEPIDPVAGHIPGALHAYYEDNFTPEGRFRPAAELRRYYQDLLGDVPAENTAFYCGSGVTSIVPILAMVHAGLDEPRLYAGSWSEWITGPNRPIET